MAGPCPHCGGEKHHAPTCPEMFWPDGQRRGSNPGLPPRVWTADELAEMRSPGWKPDPESPLALELGRIFAGSTERMIEAHIKAQKELHDAGS